MAAVTIDVDDLRAFAPDIDDDKAEAMIADALALAAQAAPCILEDDFEYADAARAIIRGAILRWNDTGSGAITQMSAGPFQQTIDNRTTRRSMFFPNEITQLQKLCGSARSGRAYSVATTPPQEDQHPLFGALVNGPEEWTPGSRA